MILDLQTMLSGSVAADGTKTGQPITATAISANVIDLRLGSALALADDYKRFMGLRYTVSAGFTAFGLLAYVTENPQRNTSQRSGFTIDA